MTKTNSTAKKRGLQPSVKVGDVIATYRSGNVTVIEYIDSKNVTVRFNDEHGHELKTTTGNLKAGSVKNPYTPIIYGVGYFGVGRFKAGIGKNDTVEYKAWAHMICRCYDEKELLKYPTYRGCTVHPDWHNFQVFAKWYTSHKYYGLGYHLDKDLLFPGNKIYSAHNCELVPSQINTLLIDAGANRGDLPIGVSYNKRSRKYTSYLRIDGNKKFLGYFDCHNKAHEAYKRSKREHIKTKALEWRCRMDERVFESLLSISNKLI